MQKGPTIKMMQIRFLPLKYRVWKSYNEIVRLFQSFELLQIRMIQYLIHSPYAPVYKFKPIKHVFKTIASRMMAFFSETRSYHIFANFLVTNLASYIPLTIVQG